MRGVRFWTVGRPTGIVPKVLCHLTGAMSETAGQNPVSVEAEVVAWFFEEYFPQWVAAAQGDADPAFIHRFWGTPMHVSVSGTSFWCRTEADVSAFLAETHRPLRENDYHHTVVPDRKVTVYSPSGAAIEAIWSRRRADEFEIQRLAVHLEIARLGDGWRVVGIQGHDTRRDTLAEAWADQAAERIDRPA